MFREHGKHMYSGTGVLGVEGEQVHLNCHCRTMYTHCCSMVASYTGLNFMQSGWNMGVQNPMFMSMLGSQKFVVTSMANTAMYKSFRDILHKVLAACLTSNWFDFNTYSQKDWNPVQKCQHSMKTLARNTEH